MSYTRQSDLPYPQPWEYVLDNIIGRKNNLFFVDVGANDGLTVSNTAYMELDLNWKGICIEPHPEAYIRLDNNRYCKKYNCCVSTKEENIDFIAVKGYGEMLSGIKDSTSTSHINRITSEIEKHGGSMEIIKIKSKSLASILEENSITHIHYLSIDVEGSELDVLQSINFDIVKIDVISAENSDNNIIVKQFLENKGYILSNNICGDDIFVKK